MKPREISSFRAKPSRPRMVRLLALAASAIAAPAAAQSLTADACAALTAPIAASAIGLPSGEADIDSAAFSAPAPLVIAERGPTPASRIGPATPAYCKILGHIQPIDSAAPPIQFEVNLPAQWNGRSVQYGGGGFNGVLISGIGLPPAARFDRAVAAGARLCDLRHGFRPPGRAGPAGAGLCAERRSLRQFQPRVLQEGARRRGRVDEARLRHGAGEALFHGQFRGRARSADDGAALSRRLRRHLRPRARDQLDGVAARGNPRRPGDDGRGLAEAGAGKTRRRRGSSRLRRRRRHCRRCAGLSDEVRPREAALHGGPDGRRLPEPGAGRRRQYIAFALSLLVPARQRGDRISRLGRLGRGDPRERTDWRLERVVARRRASEAAALRPTTASPGYLAVAECAMSLRAIPIST